MTTKELNNILIGKLLTDFLHLEIDKRGFVHTLWGWKDAEGLGDSIRNLLIENHISIVEK